MIFRESIEEDITLLTEISKSAFGTDSSVGGKVNEGPPGYDSFEWHREMMQKNNLFTYLNKHEIAGGAVLFEDGLTVYVGRIFISPKFFKQGLGQLLMQDVESYFPGIKKTSLDTPLWNVRTNNFYLKCGYSEIKREDESVYYEKTLVR